MLCLRTESVSSPTRSRVAAYLSGLWGLVLALGQILRQAVRQGEIRRAATATNTAAFWNCHSSHSRELRDSCLVQLNLPNLAPSVADATPQGQHLVAVDLGAPSGRH